MRNIIVKSSYRDHLRHKIKPTFFGLFEKQDDALLNNVYSYIYGKDVWHYPAIGGCGGVVSGGYRPVTFAMVTSEFNACNQKTQNTVLARVNQYVIDFEAATLMIPTAEARERLLQVRDYFQEHVKEPSLGSSYSS